MCVCSFMYTCVCVSVCVFTCMQLCPNLCKLVYLCMLCLIHFWVRVSFMCVFVLNLSCTRTRRQVFSPKFIKISFQNPMRDGVLYMSPNGITSYSWTLIFTRVKTAKQLAQPTLFTKHVLVTKEINKCNK